MKAGLVKMTALPRCGSSAPGVGGSAGMLFGAGSALGAAHVGIAGGAGGIFDEAAVGIVADAAVAAIQQAAELGKALNSGNPVQNGRVDTYA